MARKPKRRAQPPAPEAPGSLAPGDALFARRLDLAREALQRIESGQSPTAGELAAAPRLDFWCVVIEPPFPVLQGVVTGHPHLADGALVGTSPLVWLADDKSAARTLSRFYRLGVPLAEAMPRQG